MNILYIIVYEIQYTILVLKKIMHCSGTMFQCIINIRVAFVMLSCSATSRHARIQKTTTMLQEPMSICAGMAVRVSKAQRDSPSL